MTGHSTYIPSLRYNWLTQFYDWLLSTFLRERTFKSTLIESIRPRTPKHILDIGCGTCTLSLMIEEAFPEACISGLDGDPVVLAIAKKKLTKAHSKIKLVQAMSYSMPLSNNLFHVVTCSLMLHHLNAEAKASTLRECYRVVQPNGTIAVADWGKPSNFLMRLVFYLVQLLDGFETTTDNVKGNIPSFIEKAGFSEVNELKKVDTFLGTISIYQGLKKSKEIIL